MSRNAVENSMRKGLCFAIYFSEKRYLKVIHAVLYYNQGKMWMPLLLFFTNFIILIFYLSLFTFFWAFCFALLAIKVYHLLTSSSHKSFHNGFIELISKHFFFLLPPLILFSSKIASSILEYHL